MSYRRRSSLFRAIEQLETRTLMHGDGDGFHADINFQPAASPAVDGYFIDSGQVFGDRGNGLSYGWNADDSVNTRERNSSLSSDQLHDTLIHMQKNGSFKWNLAVPNGTYAVHIVSGDPTATDSNYRINVENTLLVNGKPSSSKHWVEGSAQISVSDGLLTVSNASGSYNNKICYIEVEAVDTTPPDPGVETVEVSTPDATASEANLDPGVIRFKRSGPIDQDLTVNYYVTGTAVPADDYDALPASIVIPAGQTTADLVITPHDDSVLEPAKSVLVEIRAGEYEIGDSKSGVVTIMDDETSDTEQPYFGTPQRFSATVQAEDFDQGPSGVSYKDKTPGNASGVYYRFSDVDIAPTTDLGGGFAVTHLQKDEYLKYTVNVPETGTYRIETRIASNIISGSYFHISFDGKSTGSQQFVNTGGLEKWTTLKKTATLTAGLHVMKFYVDTTKTGGEVGSLNYIRIYRDLSASSGVSFKSVAPLPFAREEGQSATLGGQYYVFGGLYTNVHFLATPRVDRYDPATNTWTRMADMPEAFTHAAVVTVSDTQAWFIGGYLGDHPGPGTTHVWIYDASTDTWSAGPDLPFPRGAGGAGLITFSTPDPTDPTLPPIVHNEIHFFGGRDYNRDTDEVDHLAFDLNAPDLGWQTRAPLPSPRNHLSGAVIDGKLYAIAGEQLEESSAINQSEMDVYDPMTDTWSRGTDLPLPLSHVHQSTLVLNGKIITIGGELSHNVSADLVLMYDPASDLWSIIGTLPSARRAMMAGVLNGQLIATGGYLNGKQYTNTWVTSLKL